MYNDLNKNSDVQCPDFSVIKCDLFWMNKR